MTSVMVGISVFILGLRLLVEAGDQECRPGSEGSTGLSFKMETKK